MISVLKFINLQHLNNKNMEEIIKVNKKDLLGWNETGELKYADDDIVLIQNNHRIPFDLQAIRVDMLLIVFCKEGRIQLNINGTSHTACKGNLIICNGLQILSDAMFSSDFCCDLTGISNQRFDEIIHSSNQLMDTFLYLNTNPVLNLAPEEFKLLTLYVTFLEEKLNMQGHAHLTRVINGILTAAIFDFMGIIERQRTIEATNSTNPDKPSQHKNDLVRQFLLMLVEDNAQHHTVEYFANRLCITPKYLSVICRKQTDKTPSLWIREQQIEKIRTLLTTTTLSSKEIASRLNFSNTSFFGKFTRQHLGCSPMEYRRRHT